HGTHHVAQKLRKVTSPPGSRTLTCSPSSKVSVKSGARCPTRLGAGVAVGRGVGGMYVTGGGVGNCICGTAGGPSSSRERDSAAIAISATTGASSAGTVHSGQRRFLPDAARTRWRVVAVIRRKWRR